MAAFDPKVLLAGYWDSKDVDAFCGDFADDAVWTVNTFPPSSDIRTLTETLMGTTKSSRHFELFVFATEKTDTTPKTVCCHGRVEYEVEGREDKVTCRFSDIFELNDEGKIAKCWTYMDTTPLAPPAPAAESS